MKKSESQALEKYMEYQRMLKNIYGEPDESLKAENIREKMDALWPKLAISSRKILNKSVKLPKPTKVKSPAEKVIENLIILTSVPIEKSLLQWRMDWVFDRYYFQAEFKNKIYNFDGRHFYVYPAGYELPPGISIGDKKGPEILLDLRVDSMPQLLGELWQRLCGQHEKELQEDERKRKDLIENLLKEQKSDKTKVEQNAEEMLEDFKFIKDL